MRVTKSHLCVLLLVFLALEPSLAGVAGARPQHHQSHKAVRPHAHHVRSENLSTRLSTKHSTTNLEETENGEEEEAGTSNEGDETADTSNEGDETDDDANENSYPEGVRVDVIEVTRSIPLPDGGTRTILDDVSVSIRPGEIVALMGPSGAGKSTLLETIMGAAEPSKGMCLFNGQKISQLGLLRERIGYVPQEDIMHRDLTVREVLYYAGKLRMQKGTSEKEINERAVKVATDLGIAHQLDRIVGGAEVRGISGGERKRVNIGMELMNYPSVLFLDEPSSGLDSSATLLVMNSLYKLSREEHVTIMATIHQPRTEVFNKFDRALILAKGGSLAYFGPTETIRNHFEKCSSDDSHNDADFAIDALEPPNNPDDRKEPAFWKAYYRSTETCRANVFDRQQSLEYNFDVSKIIGRPGFSTQFSVLFKRETKRIMKQYSKIITRMVVTVLLGALFGLSIDPEDEFKTVQGGFFYLSLCLFFLANTNTAREVVSNKDPLEREMRSGLDPIAFYIALAVFHIIHIVAQIILMLGAWYGMLKYKKITKEKEDVITKNLGFMFFVLILVGIAGVFCGLLISVLSKDEVTAVTQVPYVVIPNMVYSGYGTKTYQKFKIHEKIISDIFFPVRHAFEAMVKKMTSDDPKTGAFSETLVEMMYGYESLEIGSSIGKLFLNIFVYMLPGVYYMQKKSPPKVTPEKPSEDGGNAVASKGPPFTAGCDELKSDFGCTLETDASQEDDNPEEESNAEDDDSEEE